MPRTITDLSIYLENDVISDPEPFRPKIEYIDHAMSVDDLAGFLPPSGFMIACFPVKIRDASAGWTRAVAIIDG